jgi:AcrR family transcriptional regulator
VINFGAGRITLSDVGRRAGVSRMTVNDRVGNLHDLMRALTPALIRAVNPGAKRTELLQDLEYTLHGAIALPTSGHQALPSWQ